MVGKSLKVKHKYSFRTLLLFVSPSLTHLTKVKNDLLRIMRPEVEFNYTEYLDSTLVTCIRLPTTMSDTIPNDHAVQYCWPRERERACADSGISAVVQWFDKSLSWTTWFQHFQAVAELQDGMMSIRWSSWYPILLSSP